MTDQIVYEPNRRPLARLPSYVRSVWDHRQLALDLARADVKSRHQDTVLGQAWQLLNPILLALAYLFLFEVIASRPGGIDFLAFLLAGLFPFYFTRDAVVSGASSITGGSWLVNNTRLPRALLPIGTVIVALRSFCAAAVVYVPVHVTAGRGASWALLALFAVFAFQTVFNLGLAMVLSTASVFVRDVRTALPFGVRIWLYVSPVLYAYEEVPAKLEPVLIANPLTAFLVPVDQVLTHEEWPDAAWMLGAAAWSVGALVIGCLFFISKEHEFAFRL